MVYAVVRAGGRQEKVEVGTVVVLEDLVEAVGVRADEANITFCNTGHWASVAWFGLSEVLGNEQSAMYDGSMSEWTQDPARPLDPPRAIQ